MAANRRVLKLFKNTPPRSTSSNHSISPRPQHHVRCCSTAHNPCRSILPLGQRSQLVNWRGAATSSGVTSVVATSPAVRTLLATHKLDAGLITPTGPKNRLLKGDVLKYMQDGGCGNVGTSKPKPKQAAGKIVTTTTAESHEKDPKPKEVKSGKPSKVVATVTTKYTDNPVDTMRATIAKRLTKSKASIPYGYASVECGMDELLAVRKKLKAAGKILSVNDFLIKAAALTLQRLPESNAALTSTGDTERLTSIDIAVAVATATGVITPIIRNADRLGLEEISSSMKELGERARAKRLKPHEYQGGSIGLSNLGMYGITEFTAIISPPQSAILSVGGLKMAARDGKPCRCLTATLSCDTRVLDYELACRWLAVFRGILEQPHNIMGTL